MKAIFDTNILVGDVNGDAVADVEVLVKVVQSLQETNFGLSQNWG